MTNIFCWCYARVRGRNHFLSMFRFYSFLRLIVRYTANIVLPVYFRLTASGTRNRLSVTGAGFKDGIIVSLTSFPNRINRVWVTIETLMRQTRKPDGIILWLSKEQFPDLSYLPMSLLGLCERGLWIELRVGDLRSHKKFYYAKREFPDATIVLCDDDIFYPNTMLEELFSASVSFPGKVICRLAKRMVWSSKGELMPYATWKTVNEGRPERDYFFGSGGGVLIPPNAIHFDVLNRDAFLKYCPFADDIWLNAMCRLVSLEMVSLNKQFSLLPVVNPNNVDLSSINNGQQMNDRQLYAIRKFCRDAYGQDPFEFIEK
jgi:hypothetical protein